MATNARAIAKALLQLPPAGTPAAGTALMVPNGGGFGANSTNTDNGLSPIVSASYQDWTTGRAFGNALPRDWFTFQSGSFGPLPPMVPIPVDTPPEGFDRAEPRRTQMPPAWNMPMGPPGSEGFKLASFSQLRSLSNTYSVARACIDLRKSELIGLEWDMVPTKAAEKKLRGDEKARREFDERRAKVVKFFRRPDPDYFSFQSWFNAQLEDILAIDAHTLYLRPPAKKGKGVLGSNLVALESIDGAGIRPLVDMRGGRPKPPNPAFQQYLYGVPRTDLMTILSGEDIAEMSDAKHMEFRGDQLLYLPYEWRNYTPYGMAPIEKTLVPILSGLNRQGWQLSYFSEGSVPAIFLSAMNPDATPAQLRELQDAINAMAGDPAWKHKVIVIPGGAKIDPMRPTELAGHFDEMIVSQVCMGFGVMPMELGIMPRSSSSGHSGGAMNQMGKQSRDIQDRKANIPLLHRFMEVFDYIIQVVLKQDDMRFLFEGLEEGEDEQTVVTTQINEIEHGLLSVDEARIARGRQPWGLPITSDPVWATATGVVPLGSIDPATGMPKVTQPDQTQALSGTPPQGQNQQQGQGQQAGRASTPAHASARQEVNQSGNQQPDNNAGQQTTQKAIAFRRRREITKVGPHGYEHGWIKVAPGDRLSGWSRLSQSQNHLGIAPEFPNESIISSHSVPARQGEVRVSHSVNVGDAMPTTTVTAGLPHDLAGWNAGDDGKTVILDHTDPDAGPQLDQALSDGLAGKTTHVPGSDWGDLQVAPHADGVKLTVLPYQGEVDAPETRQEFVKRVIAEGKQTDLDDEEPPRTDQEWQAFADLAWQDELAERAADEAANATPDLSAVLTPAQVADLRNKLRVPDPVPAAKSVNVFAALHELDLLRRRIVKGRGIGVWTVEHIPADIFAGLDATTDSIEHARLLVKAEGLRQTRDAQTAPMRAAIADGLRRLTAGLDHGTISTATFVDEAVDVIAAQIQQALAAGAAHARQASKEMSQELADWKAAFDARFDQYANTAVKAWEEGRNLATLAIPGEWLIRWLAKTGACDLCAARNDLTFPPGELPGYPGMGGFGKLATVCRGNGNCRCSLQYELDDGGTPLAITPPSDHKTAFQADLTRNVASIQAADSDPQTEAEVWARIAVDRAEGQRAYLTGLLQDLLGAAGRAQANPPGHPAEHISFPDAPDGGPGWLVPAAIVAAGTAAAVSSQAQAQQQAAPAAVGTTDTSGQPVTKAAEHGHHVPGTPTEYTHGWKLISPSEHIRERTKDLGASFDQLRQAEGGGDVVDEHYRRMADNLAAMEVPSGTKVYAKGPLRVVYQPQEQGTVDEPRVIAQAQRALEDLHARHPLPGKTYVHLTNQPIDSHSGGMADGQSHIMIARGHLWAEPNPFDARSYMPSVMDNSGVRYTIAHEYGHRVADSQGVTRHVGSSIEMHNQHRQSLSSYGQSDPAEAYAEAFAEYQLTNGQTTNPAAQAYAKRFGWAVDQPITKAFNPAEPRDRHGRWIRIASDLEGIMGLHHTLHAHQGSEQAHVYGFHALPPDKQEPVARYLARLATQESYPIHIQWGPSWQSRAVTAEDEQRTRDVLAAAGFQRQDYSMAWAIKPHNPDPHDLLTHSEMEARYGKTLDTKQVGHLHVTAHERGRVVLSVDEAGGTRSMHADLNPEEAHALANSLTDMVDDSGQYDPEEDPETAADDLIGDTSDSDSHTYAGFTHDGHIVVGITGGELGGKRDLQHDLTPEQATQLATDLQALADNAEAAGEEFTNWWQDAGEVFPGRSSAEMDGETEALIEGELSVPIEPDYSGELANLLDQAHTALVRGGLPAGVRDPAEPDEPAIVATFPGKNYTVHIDDEGDAILSDPVSEDRTYITGSDMAALAAWLRRMDQEVNQHYRREETLKAARARIAKAFNQAEPRDDHGRWTLLGAAIHSLANLSDHEFAQHFGPPVGEKHVDDTGIRVTAHDTGHVVLSVNDGAGHTPLARLTPDEAENLGIGLSDMADDSLNHDPEDYPDTGNSEIIDDSTGHRLALADHQPFAGYDNTGDMHLIVPNGNRDGSDRHEEMSADSARNLETALDDMANLATDAADRRADREAEQELAAQQAAAEAAWEAANATRGRPGDVDTHQWWQTHGTVLPNDTGVAMLDDHTIGIRYNPYEGDSNTETAEVPTTAVPDMVEALRYLQQQISTNPDHPDGYLVNDHLSVDYRDGEVTLTDEANNTETTIWNEDIDPLIAELQRLAAGHKSATKAASDLWDPNPVDAQHVYNQLSANYPAKALGWVKDARWIGPVQVPQARIDDDDMDKWAASHQPKRVNHFVQRVRAGDDPHPAVLVQEPGDDKVKVIDGHHRTLAWRKLGKPVTGYVGFVDSDGGPWDETHAFQHHQGDDPVNKASAHGHHIPGTPFTYRHGWIPAFSHPSGTDMRAVGQLRTQLRLKHPEGYSLHQSWQQVDGPYPPEKIEPLLGRLPRPVALRTAREADVENSFRRFVQMQRPEVPNEDPYADLPPITDAEMEAAKTRAAQYLRDELTGKPVAIRMKEADLAAVLHDGRVKTAFETRRSSSLGGSSASYRKMRAEREEMLFGIPQDAPGDARPIYGYVSPGGVQPIGESDRLAQYGDVQVVLKPYVQDRTTVSEGDSLDEDTLPSPMTDPQWYSFNGGVHGNKIGEAAWGPVNWARHYTYPEAQIHGGVTTTDIQTVVFNTEPSPALAQSLRKQGIPWHVLREGDAPLGSAPQVTKAAKQPVAAGIAVQAADTGRVLMLQRALK